MANRSRHLQQSPESVGGPSVGSLAASHQDQRIYQDKAALRDLLKSKIARVESPERVSWSLAISRIIGLQLKDQKGVWGAFMALDSEPDLAPLFAAGTPIEWAFPRIDGSSLVFLKDCRSWKKSSFGVLEPDEGTPVSLASLGGFLVPGLGFTSKGARLGRGRGFYDRVLQGVRVPKVGVCFYLQVIDGSFITELHDQTMDAVVTEKGWLLEARF